jgi:DNA transformation protein and related proteins
MSTKQGTIDYILEQLTGVGVVRVRKMFGEYALYCDEKVVGLVCDDQLYIKYTDKGREFAEGKFVEGFAYVGAKPSMNVTDQIDNKDFLCSLIRITADSLPLPKIKKK